MQPLADKIRPQTLDEFVGQTHLVGKDGTESGPIRQAIENKHIFSFILWGPPGVGKTTIARIYANALGLSFQQLSAVSAKKDDVRAVVEQARERRKLDAADTVVLFLDEIHRFNKAQQDFLLPHVESGLITLIGATTENPSFEVIGALLSRSQVFTLKSLTDSEMSEIIERATAELELELDSEAQDFVIQAADGDARRAIAMLEAADNLYDAVTLKTLTQSLQNNQLRYDKAGEEHYNTISAFIKSMRASQPNAALYYLARMIEAGEDPKFIARRMVIFASEDVGQATPTALVVANAAFRAVETIGLPEAEINLADVCVYLSNCKKDRSSYDAYRRAQADVRQHGNLEIPKKIRNAPTELMKQSGYGEGYEMYDADSLLPDKITGTQYYQPDDKS